LLAPLNAACLPLALPCWLFYGGCTFQWSDHAMHKALVDSLVRLPSGRLAVVLQYLAGDDVLLKYTDGGGKLEINAKFLRPASESIYHKIGGA